MKISNNGYKKNSKDRNEDSLIIPSNHITMSDVPHNVWGIDNLGNHQMMYPGMDYTFPGDYVKEIPIKKQGGQMKKPNNKGFDALPKRVQDIIMNKKQDGGEAQYLPRPIFMQMGGNMNDDLYSVAGYMPASNPYLQDGGGVTTKEVFGELSREQDAQTFKENPKGRRLAELIKQGYRNPDNTPIYKVDEWNPENIQNIQNRLRSPKPVGSNAPLSFPQYGMNSIDPTTGAQYIDWAQNPDYNLISGTDGKRVFQSNYITPPGINDKKTSTNISGVAQKFMETFNPKTGKTELISFPQSDYLPTQKVNTPLPQQGLPEFVYQNNPALGTYDEQFNKYTKANKLQYGGNLDKFITNYQKQFGGEHGNENIQGQTMDQLLQDKNNDFVNYLANNTKKALYKNEVNNFQNNFMQTGGPFGQQEPVPNYVTDFTQQYNLPNMESQPVNPYQFTQTENGVDPQQAWFDNEVAANQLAFDKQQQSKQNNNNAIADVSMMGAQGINSFFNKINAQKQQEWATQQMAISNTSPTTYGSQGDYDMNQGKLKPNQTTPGSFKKGGTYKMDKKTINDLISQGYNIEFLD